MKTNQQLLAQELLTQLSGLTVNCRKLTISEITFKLTQINQTHTQLYFAAKRHGYKIY